MIVETGIFEMGDGLKTINKRGICGGLESRNVSANCGKTL